jgi:hypothetical protein
MVKPEQGRALTCVVVDTTFTRGSPFGEQWWAVVDADGDKHSFAMWLDFRITERWPRPGDTVELKPMGDRKCSTGGGGAIICGPCAELVKIVRRKDDVAA